ISLLLPGCRIAGVDTYSMVYFGRHLPKFDKNGGTLAAERLVARAFSAPSRSSTIHFYSALKAVAVRYRPKPNTEWPITLLTRSRLGRFVLEAAMPSPMPG